MTHSRQGRVASCGSELSSHPIGPVPGARPMPSTRPDRMTLPEPCPGAQSTEGFAFLSAPVNAAGNEFTCPSHPSALTHRDEPLQCGSTAWRRERRTTVVDDDEITRNAFRAAGGDRAAATRFAADTRHQLHRFLAALSDPGVAEDL